MLIASGRQSAFDRRQLRRQNIVCSLFDMANLVFFGVLVSLINIVYSFCHLVSDKIHPGVASMAWIIIYVLNITLNVNLSMRLLKRSQLVIILWFSYTIVLFLCRLFVLDYAVCTQEYRMFLILTNYYIGISFLIMAAVYISLNEEQLKQPTARVNQTRRYKSSNNRRVGWKTTYTPRNHDAPGDYDVQHRLYLDLLATHNAYAPSAPEITESSSTVNQENQFEIKCGDRSVHNECRNESEVGVCDGADDGCVSAKVGCDPGSGGCEGVAGGCDGGDDVLVDCGGCDD